MTKFIAVYYKNYKVYYRCRKYGALEYMGHLSYVVAHRLPKVPEAKCKYHVKRIKYYTA